MLPAINPDDDERRKYIKEQIRKSDLQQQQRSEANNSFELVRENS